MEIGKGILKLYAEGMRNFRCGVARIFGPRIIDLKTFCCSRLNSLMYE